MEYMVKTEGEATSAVKKAGEGDIVLVYPTKLFRSVHSRVKPGVTVKLA